MSFHNAIESGKEHRIEYGIRKGTYCKFVDPMCRNHGGCSYCESNRLHNEKKRLAKANYNEGE